MLRFFSETTKKSVLPNVQKTSLPGIGRIILASSSKGGVGKSMISVNVAASLQKFGMKTGVFDANVYSPSIPRMLGTTKKLIVPNKDHYYRPVLSDHNIYSASVGNIVDQKTSLSWKAPYIGGVVADFLRKASWPELDYLIIDTPPGSSDIHIMLTTLLKIDGALIVTLPEFVSGIEAERTTNMLKNFKVPVLGVVQNMYGYKCSECGEFHVPFKHDSVSIVTNHFRVDNLGSLPLDPEISKCCDSGVPLVFKNPDSQASKAFEKLAKNIMNKLPKVSPELPPLDIKGLPNVSDV